VGFVNLNIKTARKSLGMRQEDVATKLNVARSTYASWEKDISPDFDSLARIAKLFGYKYNDLTDEEFIQKNGFNEPEKEYKRKRVTVVEIPNTDEFQANTAMEIKAMLRVMLRSQAHILATQQKRPVNEVLKEMTKAVADELSADFDEL